MGRTAPLRICICACICGSSMVSPLSAAAAPAPPNADADEPPEDPSGELDEAEAEVEQPVELLVEELLRDGGSAYQLANFDLAIEKFEAAYDLSPRPQLLYNLALAYFRRHDGSSAAADLHRARALLTNFDIALQRDPSLGDSENVQRLIDQVDEAIAASDQRERELDAERLELERAARAEAAQAAVDACPEAPAPELPDGRTERLVGASILSLGGASFTAGIASIATFAVKGQGYTNSLLALESEAEALGCAGAQTSATCAGYDEAIAGTITNGRRANVFAAAIGGSLTALGAAGLVAGAVVFTRGKALSRGGTRSASFHLVPSLGGVALLGQF